MPSALVPVLPRVETAAATAAAVDASFRKLAERQGAYAVLVAEPGDAWRGRAAELLADALPGVAELLAAYPTPEPGATTVIPLPGGPIACVVVAAAREGDRDALRRAAGDAARAAGSVSLLGVQVVGADAPADVLVEGAVLGSAGSVRWSADGPVLEGDPVRLLLIGEYAPEPIELGAHSAGATLTARGYANAPSNIKNPAWIAEAARGLARTAKLRYRVWDEKALAKDGFGGILAVGQGSVSPPRLVQLSYTPRGASGKPIVLVGKGITFDTGGLDVKPSAAMLMMKTDMSGAAIVLAVLAACHALRVPRPVIGLLPLAENAFGGNSYRPSDVVTHYGGATVEIGNTDAEGRLVLADALAYAVAELDPAAVVDIATLTGAARIALGTGMAPSYATDEDLHARVRSAFAAAGEPLWAMPLVDDYRPAIDSDVADLSHIGPLTGGPGGGSILAALFLREFTGEVPWVHLDIAGAGRSEADTGVLAKGATGYGARGLLRWLREE